jgi:hypothetical protein
MTPPNTQPTQVVPEWGYAEPPKKRRWPWVVILVIVVVGAVVAWFAAEAAARDIVEKSIRNGVIEQLSLPADQEIDVEVPGAIIPQLIRGRLDTVTIASEDVPLQGLVGDITVVADDVRVREPNGMSGATAQVILDEEQLRALMSNVNAFPADTLGLAEPNVTMTVELSVLGVGIPVAASLTPSAVEGELVLSPASLQVAGGEITADGLREQFGGIADAVLRDWPVCVAQYLPAGVVLTGAEVSGSELIADFDVDSGILTSNALQEPGVCE